MIKVNNIECNVIEDLGFNQSRQQYAKIILYKGQETTVLKSNYSNHWKLAEPRIESREALTGQ